MNDVKWRSPREMPGDVKSRLSYALDGRAVGLATSGPSGFEDLWSAETQTKSGGDVTMESQLNRPSTASPPS
eukprot:s4949_g2.t1